MSETFGEATLRRRDVGDSAVFFEDSFLRFDAHQLLLQCFPESKSVNETCKLPTGSCFLLFRH